MYVLSILLFSNIVQSQVRPVCDEIAEIPYELSYNGFVITDSNSLQTVGQKSISITVTSDSITGQQLLFYSYNSDLGKTGFFTAVLPSDKVLFLIEHINRNPDKNYFINVTYDSRYIGSQEILSVPYAQVANAIGGFGPRGAQGPHGPQGDQGLQGERGRQGNPGPQGPAGLTGPNDFGTDMIMTDLVPNSSDISFYIDDGTNTSDGKPRLRYNAGTFTNPNWIDL